MHAATALRRLVSQSQHRCTGSSRALCSRLRTVSPSAAPPAARLHAWNAAARPFTTTRSSGWSDFNAVTKALCEIARELELTSGNDSTTTRNNTQQTPRLPDTKLLKELGHHELVHAIRKKHGGFVNVMARMGVAPAPNALEIHKQKSSRANRRAKRSMRLAKHDYY